MPGARMGDDQLDARPRRVCPEYDDRIGPWRVAVKVVHEHKHQSTVMADVFGDDMEVSEAAVVMSSARAGTAGRGGSAARGDGA